jgi:hypothetical protein
VLSSTDDARETSIAIGPDLRPVIAYSMGAWLGAPGPFKMAICNEYTCASGASLAMTGGETGHHNAVALGADNVPVVAYDGADDLRFLYCTNCDTDHDNDGCRDASEQQTAGGSEGTGGRRNPKYFWDFYDTPNASNVRDKVVTVTGDIFQVSRRFGANDAGGTAPINRNSDPLAGPPPPFPAYHPAFDRGPLNGPNSWNLTAADGTISVAVDVLGVSRQFGHSCL